MKSTLFIAALFAAATASAQSSLLLPNNSAGTEMDTPPVLPSATPGPVEPASRADNPGTIDARRGPMMRGEIRELREPTQEDVDPAQRAPQSTDPVK